MTHTYTSQDRLVTFHYNPDLSGDVTITEHAADGRKIKQIVLKNFYLK